jgi:EAL domain-containing protein (putative c-di-GMP-specific phosphodiesterase class I)
MLVFDIPSPDSALDIAGLLQKTLQQPFELRKHQLNVAAQVGVTCIDSGLQRAEEAVREADIALSVAKRHDTATAVAYQPAMGSSAASLVSLEADLHVALQRRELHMMYQPIVDLRNDCVAGAESLLRWRHPIEGMLTPDKFLALAEEVGLIVPITRWTILQACTLASEWRHRLPRDRDFYLTVNVSAAALRDPEFTSYVEQVLKDTGVSPEYLKLELTEGGLMSNPGGAREILEGLHDLGIEMMLDDFGTGYSSLSYLQLFPFSYVKIDRPFVDRAGSAHANTAIAAAIVQMTSSLGLRSIAEIVETDDAARDLQRMGCDYAQGYFYCGPLEAEEAFQVLKNADRSLPTAQAAIAADESSDNSPTLSEAVVLSDETLMLPADEVAEQLREKAAQEH